MAKQAKAQQAAARTPEFGPSSHPLEVTPLASFQDFTAKIADDGAYWGIVLTAATATIGRKTGHAWRGVVTSSASPLLEARLFNEQVDLLWRESNGVALTETGSGAAAVGGSSSWLERERCSRLWGERSNRGDGWREDRIPAVQSYGDEFADHQFVGLSYREYLINGRVDTVRFLALVPMTDDAMSQDGEQESTEQEARTR